MSHIVLRRIFKFRQRTGNFSTFELSEEHKLLQKTCRSFAENELRPIARQLDNEEKFPKEQIEKLGSLGLLAITASTEYGGSALDTLSLSIAVDELSRGCASTGAIVSIHNSLYINTLEKKGTNKQREEFLRPFTNGVIGAFALSESGAGSDVGAMSTTAKKDGEFWILNGRKSWVTSAIEAEAAIVFATIDKSMKHKGITAFLVNMNTPGLSRGRKEKKLGIRATSTCDLVLEDVRIHESNILGNTTEGFKIAMEQLDHGRIGIASQALGIAQAALDTTVDYAGKRIAFNQPLLRLPTVQTRLAEMAIKLEAARLLTRQAAVKNDSGERSTKYTSMAKLAASECATFCAHNCQQILGGNGYVNDYPAERYYRDARITEIYGGISDIQKLVVAERLIKEYGI